MVKRESGGKGETDSRGWRNGRGNTEKEKNTLCLLQQFRMAKYFIEDATEVVKERPTTVSNNDKKSHTLIQDKLVVIQIFSFVRSVISGITDGL